MHTRMKRDEEPPVRCLPIQLKQPRRKQVNILRIGMELDPMESEVSNTPHLVAHILSSGVDCSKTQKPPGMFLQFTREPGIGIHPFSIALMGKRGKTDRAIDLAGIEHLKQPVDSSLWVQ